MYKTIIISFVLLLSLQVKAQKMATIKGSMKGYKYDLVLKGETAIDYLKAEKTAVERDDNGKFDIKIELTKPQMLSLGYATFYLTPGANIEIVETFDNKRWKYSFKGDNAEINNYIISHYLHTKSGSWCQAGMNVMNRLKIEDFISFCKVEKDKFLNDLKDVKASKAFKAKYKKRINLHYYNSLMNYPFFASYYEKGMDVAPLYDAIKKEIPRKIEISDIDMDISRSILSSNVVGRLEIELKTSKEVDNYKKVSNLMSTLESEGVSSQLLDKKVELCEKLKGTDYKDIIEKTFGEYNKVLPGALVDNLSFITPEGKTVQLSDYKGKIVVIDVWATWCGPCMKEKPHFAELAKKYSASDDVVFLAVSVDDKKAWEKYCTKKHHETENVQFANIARAKMDAAFLTKFVPRFMILGKDQKIINAFAPLPSSGGLEKLINKSLK